MTIKQSPSDIGFTRCAVCKIDLKGRFVYLDEKIESLLGFTKEELFGKSFLDFLDDPSQQLIQKLLSQRNHYETFFDTTRITAFNRSREALAMRAVVSLNFIAGNPVNYQLIIDCESERASSESVGESTSDYRSLVNDLANMALPVDWKELLKVICRFARAQQACAYLVDGESLEIRSAAGWDGVDEFEFNKIPDPEPLHQQVAQSGQEYSFVDSEAVRRVVEQSGSAPNEFVTCVDLSDGSRYLIRLMFTDDPDPKQAQASIFDARAVVNLAARMIGSDESCGTRRDNSCDVKFTIGFLDSLDVPAFLTDCEGSIIGYNPTTLNIFNEQQLGGSYLEAMNCLDEYNAPGFTRSIVDYINSSIDDEASPDELAIIINTTSSEQVRLMVLKLGDASSDLSGCFVFMPVAQDTGKVEESDESDVWQSALVHLRKRLKATEDMALKFSHEYYNQLEERGNKSLGNLSGSVRQLGTLVDELHRYSQLAESPGRPSLTDLNLLVTGLIGQLESAHPKAKIKCHHKKLPKFATHPKLLGEALGHVLDNCVVYCNKPSVEITIKSEVNGDCCCLTITDNGFGISPRHLPRIFDLLHRAPEKKVRAICGNGMGLSIAKRIMETLGGEIDVSSNVGEGTAVKITLPME